MGEERGTGQQPHGLQAGPERRASWGAPRQGQSKNWRKAGRFGEKRAGGTMGRQAQRRTTSRGV